MAAQVVVPHTMVVPLLNGTAAGDQCLERLGVDVRDVGGGIRAMLAQMVQPELSGAVDVLGGVRAVVERADRCVQLSAGSGDLRAALVFSGGDTSVEDVAVLAFGVDGLHLALVDVADMRELLVEWVGSPGGDGIRGSLWTGGAARASLTVEAVQSRG